MSEGVTLELVWAMREASNVRRCHTTPHHGEYTVGKHSFDALNLLMLLHPNPSINLIKAVMWHDFAERWVGDAPSPTLKQFSQYGEAYKKAELEIHKMLGTHVELNGYEASWLLAVDRLELLLWALSQKAMGNTNVDCFVTKLYQWLAESPLPWEVQNFINKGISFRRMSDDPLDLAGIDPAPLKDDEIPF